MSSTRQSCCRRPLAFNLLQLAQLSFGKLAFLRGLGGRFLLGRLPFRSLLLAVPCQHLLLEGPAALLRTSLTSVNYQTLLVLYAFGICCSFIEQAASTTEPERTHLGARRSAAHQRRPCSHGAHGLYV